MDETGQPNSPDPAGMHQGTGGHTEGRDTPENLWAGAAPTSDDSLAAVVQSWREPATGAISGRASVNGSLANGAPHNGAVNGVPVPLNGNGVRGRAEVRGPYADLLPPISPPVAPHPPMPPPSMPQPMPPPMSQPMPHVPAPATIYPPSDQPQPVQPPAPPMPPLYRPQTFPSQAYTSQLSLHYDNRPALPAQPAGTEEPAGFNGFDPGPATQEQPVTPDTDAPPAVLHYGHYGPDGQGWPVNTELPPGYRPIQTYQDAEPPQAPQPPQAPTYPAYPAAQAGYAPPVYGAPYGAAAEVASQSPPVPEPQVLHGEPYAVDPLLAPNNRMPGALPAYEEPTPLFDQQPPPFEPTFDWSMPQYPSPRPPADDLAPTSAPANPSPVQPTLPPAPVAAVPADAPELPQRVPAQPDVPGPALLEPCPAEPLHAAAPDLARIATYLRHDDEDEPEPDGRPDGFDIPGVLEAVRGVAGVREATLKPNPGGVHTLRLELAEDADPGWVSRAVARLLNERMGLAAEPNLPPAPLAALPVAAVPVAPTSAPGHGREARRRRPVSGQRRAEEAAPPPVVEAEPEPRPLPEFLPAPEPHEEPFLRTDTIASPRVLIDQVEVSTQGVDAIVEVRLIADGVPALGTASGPAVDGYMLRLSAVAAASAIDELLVDAEAGARGRCYIEHAALVPLGSCEVAVVVLLLMCDGWVEQLTGSAVISGDPRQAVVRATLAAVNRRLEALLP